MRPAERRRAILATLDAAGPSSVDALALALDVSRETIRRDLSALAEEGVVIKFHGGARLPAAPPAGPGAEALATESPFAHRMAQNSEAKRRIARKVATLLARGDSLFLDTGTTTLAVAGAIAAVPNLLVITNGPRIATAIAEGPGQGKVFLIGGAFSPDAAESVGPLALEQIGRFHARHAIVTVGALDAQGITDFDLGETEIAQAMIARAEQVVVVADHGKLDRRAVFDVAPLSRIAVLVTDAAPPPALAAALAAAGVTVLIA